MDTVVVDTWGISGPTFLAIFAGLLALTAVLVAADRVREALRPAPTGPAALDDYDVAVLNGEPGLAVAVALVELDRVGAVELGHRMVLELATTQHLDLRSLTERSLADQGIGMEILLTGDLPPKAHPVESAVYAAVLASRSRRACDVRRAAADIPALQAVRSRLVRHGLLRSAAGRDRLRGQWLWFVPVLLLGLVRLGYGISRGKPVLYLVLLLVATAGAMILVATCGAGERTWQGTRALDRLRREGGKIGLEPAAGRRARDDASRRSRSRLALDGSDGLWADDRPLALAVAAIPPAPAGSRWGGGCGGGGCGGGGCGGCGGGGCGG